MEENNYCGKTIDAPIKCEVCEFKIAGLLVNQQWNGCLKNGPRLYKTWREVFAGCPLPTEPIRCASCGTVLEPRNDPRNNTGTCRVETHKEIIDLQVVNAKKDIEILDLKSGLDKKEHWYSEMSFGKDIEINQLKAKIDNMEFWYQKEKLEIISQNNLLKAEIERLKEDIEDGRIGIKSLKSENEKLKNQILIDENDMEKYQSETEYLLKQKYSLNGYVRCLSNETGRLQSEIEDVNKVPGGKVICCEGCCSNVDCDDVCKEYRDIWKENAKLKKENNTYKKLYKDCVSQIGTHQLEIKKLQSELESLKKTSIQLSKDETITLNHLMRNWTSSYPHGMDYLDLDGCVDLHARINAKLQSMVGGEK